MSYKKVLQTFANTTTEVHAIVYGLIAGFIGALTWNTEVQFIGVMVFGSILGAAFGLKQLNQMDNSDVVTEINKEPQYSVGALVIGFVLGTVVRYVHYVVI